MNLQFFSFITLAAVMISSSSALPTVTSGNVAAECLNLIANGDFEDNGVWHCPGYKYCLAPYANQPVTWYLSQGTKFELNSSWPGFLGNISLDLNSDSPYTIGQNVSLTVGKKYLLTFMLNSNPSCVGGYNRTGFVSATGARVSTFTSNEGGIAFHEGWRKVTYPFTAVKAATEIKIGSNTTGKCGPVIDTVALVKEKC